MAADVVPFADLKNKIREKVSKKISAYIQEAIEFAIEESLAELIKQTTIHVVKEFQENQGAVAVLDLNSGNVNGSFYADDLPEGADELIFDFNIISMLEEEIRENGICKGNIKWWEKMFKLTIKEMKGNCHDCEEDGSCHTLAIKE